MSEQSRTMESRMGRVINTFTGYRFQPDGDETFYRLTTIREQPTEPPDSSEIELAPFFEGGMTITVTAPYFSDENDSWVFVQSFLAES